ncbi:MAG: sulfite reductase subunit alpha [Beijerinckiaceae bacterium]|nr:sulfite reductase subunit alpha [Beijerinckiaceae bacterium]
MSFQGPLPAMTPFIPESAPFSPEQRAWLNGFFAGFVAPQPGDAQPVNIAAPAAEEDDAPWHDPSLPLGERMAMAAGKPLQRRMMAAMAQQDCGQCGYDCQNYSKAIADGAETRLNLCVPGAKDTLRMLKTLAEELGGAPPAAKESIKAETAVVAKDEVKPGYSRATPVDVRFDFRRRLNKQDSEKSTYHVEIDLSAAGIDYTVGDSFGLFPENDPDLVENVIAAIGAPRDFPIADKTLYEVLRTDMALGAAPDTLFELISFITGGERRQKAKLLAKGEDPDGDIHTLDVLAALEKFPKLRPDPEAFVECLDPLQPRLYSISSSHNAQPGRVSLTVDHVRYIIGDRIRHGVASSWLAERLAPGSSIKAYVQKAHNFALPQSTDTPIIMVGPGTGVAPFRAFLHERAVTDAKGGAWLFYGHQRRAADFFYEDEMEAFLGKGVLTKLSLAWSRDAEKKTYVQDKMREDAKELWAWLERGAHFYICGDAKRMASDVEKTLVEIVVSEGGRDEAAAKSFVAELKKTGRYQADVY